MFFFRRLAPDSQPRLQRASVALARGIVGAGVLGLVTAAGAQIQPILPPSGAQIQPILPPSIAAPVGVGLAPLAPIGAPSPIGVPSPVGGSAINMALLLVTDQLRSGTLTPDDAWQSGLLKADDIMSLLELRQRLAPDERNEELKRDLAGLLVRFAPEKVADADKLSARVRIELCHFYSETGDARAVPLCETLIKEKLVGQQEKQPTASAAEPDNPSLWLGAIIYLAQGYEHANQWQKAGETWERAQDFWQDVNWWQAGVRMDAARAYTQGDNASKAQELYEQVKKGPDSFSRGMVTYDQAFWFLDKDPAQARDMVLKDLVGLPNPKDRIGPLWVLAQAQWHLEAWPQAEVTLQELLKACAEHPASPQGSDTIQVAAQARLQTLQAWKTKTFDLPLHNLLARPDENGVYHATLYVHSLKPQFIEVRFEDDKVRLKVLTQLRQQRTNSGVLVSAYDISYLLLAPHTLVTASVQAKDDPQTKMNVQLCLELSQ